jgi:hypothetical protein
MFKSWSFMTITEECARGNGSPEVEEKYFRCPELHPRYVRGAGIISKELWDEVYVRPARERREELEAWRWLGEMGIQLPFPEENR